MSWGFKYVGNITGVIRAMNKGGGEYHVPSGNVVRPESYIEAVRIITNHLTAHNLPSEIGWQVEAWGGEISLHIDVQVVNLRMANIVNEGDKT